MDFKFKGSLIKKAKSIDETKKINCKLQFRVLKNGDKIPALCIMFCKDSKGITISEIIDKIKEYASIYFKGDGNE